MLRFLLVGLLCLPLAAQRIIGGGSGAGAGAEAGTAGESAYYSGGTTITGDSSFTRTASGQYLLEAASSETKLTLKNAGTQTGNVFEHLNSSDTVLISMSELGDLVTPTVDTNAIGVGNLAPNALSPLQVQSAADDRMAVRVMARASQTANIQEWQDSTTATMSAISPVGLFIPPSGAGEPANCVEALLGAVYYDTSDEESCTCRDDGTDLEWVKQTDPTHTGHCSI